MTPTKTLRVGLVNPVEHLHPWENVDFVNLIAGWQVFETPFAQALKGQHPVPLLFAGPLRQESTLGDQTAYSGRLRKDIHFSDGTPLTADHVATSLSRNVAFSNLATVKAQGDRVFFYTRTVNERLDSAMVTIDRAVVLEKNGRALGTGAYMLDPASTPEHLLLVRNPHFSNPAPIECIEFKTYPRNDDGHPEKLLYAVRAGDVDFTSFLLREEIQNLDSVRKSFALGSSTALLYFNTTRPLFRQALARRAMAQAINRHEIASLFYTNPLAYVASGVLPPAMEQIDDNVHFDIDRAKTLLDEAGITPPSQPLSLMTIWGQRPYLPNPQKAAALIADQLGQLGFQISVEPTSSIDEYFQRAAQGNYDLALAGWIPDTPHSIDFLDVIYGSSAIPGGGVSVMNGVNLARLNSGPIDAALAAFRDKPSPNNRDTLAELMRQELPVLGLIYGPDVIVSSWRVKNVHSAFLTQPFFHNLDLLE